MPKKGSLHQLVKRREGESSQDELSKRSDVNQIADLRRRLNDVTRLVSDWVWETNTENKLIFLSQRVADYLGFQPIELIGKKLQDIGQFYLPTGSVVEPD